MKKSVKCIIAGGIIAIAGAGLFATTLAYGATGYSSRFLTIGFDRDDREFEIGFHDDDYRAPSAPSAPEAYTSSSTNPDMGYELSRPEDPSVLTAADIRGIEFEIAAAAVEVKFGSEFGITSRGVNDLTWNYDQNAQVVYVTSKEEVTRFDDDDRKIFVTLPQGTGPDYFAASIAMGDLDIRGGTIEEVSASVAMGDVELQNVQATSFDLEAAMGDVDLENCTADEASLSVGMGDADVSGGAIGSIDADVGMGDIDLSGQLQNFDVSTGSGDIEMEIRGSSADYFITMTADMGSIAAPSGNTRSGTVTAGTDGAAYTGTAYAAMGDIKLQFRG